MGTAKQDGVRKNRDRTHAIKIFDKILLLGVLCDPALYADRNPAFPRPVRFSGSHRSSSRYQIPWAFSCFARAGMCEYL